MCGPIYIKVCVGITWKSCVQSSNPRHGQQVLGADGWRRPEESQGVKYVFEEGITFHVFASVHPVLKELTVQIY